MLGAMEKVLTKIFCPFFSGVELVPLSALRTVDGVWK